MEIVLDNTQVLTKQNEKITDITNMSVPAHIETITVSPTSTLATNKSNEQLLSPSFITNTTPPPTSQPQSSNILSSTIADATKTATTQSHATYTVSLNTHTTTHHAQSKVSDMTTTHSTASAQSSNIPSTSSFSSYANAARANNARSTAITTSNRILIPSVQGECGMECPLPRISDATFRQKWNNRHLSINCAVLFENFKEFRHVDYLEALCSIVEPSQIISIGNVGDGKISVVFMSTKIAENVLSTGITINNQFLQPIPFVSRPVRVVLSRIPAWIPDQPILAFLKQFGRVTSSIRPLPINSNKIEKFTNILSNYREVFICLDKDAKLPQHIQIVDGEDTITIDITTEQKCYACKELGHVARVCPRKVQDQAQQVEPMGFPELNKAMMPQKLLVPTRKQPAQNRLIAQQHAQHLSQQKNSIDTSSNLMDITIDDSTADSFSPPDNSTHIISSHKRTAPSKPDYSISSKIFAAVNGSESESSIASISDENSFEPLVDGKVQLSNISFENMQLLLKQSHRKRNSKIIGKIVNRFTKKPKDLLEDLVNVKTSILTNSKNPPAKSLQNVDKLIQYIESL